MKSSFQVLVGLVAVMWAVEVFNAFMGHRLNDYGILPRFCTTGSASWPWARFPRWRPLCCTPGLSDTSSGVGNILMAVAVLVLAGCSGWQSHGAGSWRRGLGQERVRGDDAVHTTCASESTPAAGVWLVGRSCSDYGHVGASGLVFGYFGFLVARGWYDRRPHRSSRS